MCGIFGLIKGKKSILKPKELAKITNYLFTLSASRGKEAAGVILINKDITYYKEPIASAQFIKTKDYKLLLNQFISSSENATIIGHSRMATNGSACDNTNNQPVQVKNVVGIHNGIIVNDKKIWQKYPHLPHEIGLDTEALLSLIHSCSRHNLLPSAVSKAYEQIKGSASIAAVHADYPYLILATNTGSLYFAYDKNVHFFVFASESYIVQRILQLSGLSLAVEQICAFSGYLIDYETLTKKKLVLNHTNNKNFSATTVRKLQKPKVIHEIKYNSLNRTSSQLIPTSLNFLSKLKQHIPNEESINRLTRCTRCILPSTMPLISFDDKGICNYCRNFKKAHLNGMTKLESVLQKYRKSTGPGDCIVAFSGGRDSSYGLHLVKNVLKMHPIAYTYDWGMVTDLARRNQARITGSLGVEHILVSADIKYKRENIRKNVSAWLKKPDLGMIPLFMAGDKQAEYYAEELKRKTGIKLVIYCRGNELENEEFKWGHCGIKNSAPGGVIHNLSLTGKLQLAYYYGYHYLTNPAYINTSIFDTLFAYFVVYGMPLDFLYLWHYINWDENEINASLKKLYDWEIDPETPTTWRIGDGSVPFYNYIYYTVQGFTENDTLRSNQIRAGILSRKKALEMVFEENKPRYEGLKWYFDAIEIDGNQALNTIDDIPKLYKS